MNQKQMYIASTIIGLFFGALGFVIIVSMSQPADAQTTGPAAQECTASSTQVSIGNQLSQTLVGSSSRRAWVRIQQPVNATNTVSITLNDVAATTANAAAQLTPATTTSPVPLYSAGLNDPFRYTGALRAITSAGTTTVLVSECRY